MTVHVFSITSLQNMFKQNRTIWEKKRMWLQACGYDRDHRSWRAVPQGNNTNICYQYKGCVKICAVHPLSIHCASHLASDWYIPQRRVSAICLNPLSKWDAPQGQYTKKKTFSRQASLLVGRINCGSSASFAWLFLAPETRISSSSHFWCEQKLIFVAGLGRISLVSHCWCGKTWKIWKWYGSHLYMKATCLTTSRSSHQSSSFCRQPNSWGSYC